MKKLSILLITLQVAIIISYYCLLEWYSHATFTDVILYIVTLIVLTGTAITTSSLIALSLISYYIDVHFDKYYGINKENGDAQV